MGFIITGIRVFKKIKPREGNVSRGYVLKLGVTPPLTHHKYQLPHIGPGEVVEQLPHRADVLQEQRGQNT